MRTAVVLASVLSATAAGASVWDHNGSVVGLQASGDKRNFYYLVPRADLPVKMGTLLFSGVRQGNRYSGTAHVFSRKCGSVGYEVSGVVAADNETITMHGKAPRRDGNCNIIGYKDEVLIFTLQREHSSTALIKKDLRGQYAIFKRVLSSENMPLQLVPARDGEHYLAFCADSVVPLSNRDELTHQISKLAYEIFITSKALTSLGYAQAAWKETLSEYESRQLDHIAESGKRSGSVAEQLGNRLSLQIREYRRTTNPKLPKIAMVEWQGPCGDYFETVRVITRPPGGRIRFFPSLYGRFCEAQGINASNFKECNQYDERSDGEEVSVSGAYIYQVTWPDGKTGSGRRDFGPNPSAKTWVIEPSSR
jgi:hypothetical protein